MSVLAAWDVVYDVSNFIGRRKELQGVQSDDRLHLQITNSIDILSSYEEVLRTYGLVFLSLPFWNWKHIQN